LTKSQIAQTICATGHAPTIKCSAVRQRKLMNEYDVIIIGSGAGGGTLAHKLAPSGKRILILERGSYLPCEKENWNPTDVFVKNRYVAKENWYDKEGKPFQPGIHYFVGGATKMCGAALYRLREQDFKAHRTADGMTPGWPISYEEMEPYYTQAEILYNVHGQRGEDPTDPPASAPYPSPLVSHEPRIQELVDQLKRAGYHPSHTPTGILLNEANTAKSVG
jgi:choline dehydrogenase-like flavoprotein